MEKSLTFLLEQSIDAVLIVSFALSFRLLTGIIGSALVQIFLRHRKTCQDRFHGLNYKLCN